MLGKKLAQVLLTYQDGVVRVDDIELIKKTAKHAVDSALKANSGVIAMDEDNNNVMSCIDFNRINKDKITKNFLSKQNNSFFFVITIIRNIFKFDSN